MERLSERTAYKQIHGKRDTQLGINPGSPVFLLDDPDGDTYCMKAASLIVDPNQTYDSLKDLGSRLKPAPGWRFRTLVLEKRRGPHGGQRRGHDHPGRAR